MKQAPGRAPVKRQCTAHSSRTGQRCRKAPVRGGTVCWTHGGSAPQVRAAAAVRVAEDAAMAAYARHSPNGDRPVDVAGELLALVAEVRRFADWAGGRIEALTAGDWRPDEPRAAAELALYERALDRSAALLAVATRLKLDAKLVRVSETQMALLGRALRALLAVAGMTPEQEARVREAAPRVIRGLTGA